MRSFKIYFYLVVNVSSILPILSFGHHFKIQLKRLFLGHGEQTGKEHVTVQLTHFTNRFNGYVTVGTPKEGEEEQVFMVDFDTGSKSFWLISSEACPGGDCSKMTQHVYYGSKSSTYEKLKDRFEKQYADGTTAKGPLVKDTVKLGIGDTKFVIKDQIFGAADEVKMMFDDQDGIFGLGLIPLGYTPGYVDSPFLSMVHQVDMQPVFGFYLCRNVKGGHAGELMFGGYDTDKVEGTFTTHDIEKSNGEYTGWYIKLKGLTLAMANGQQSNNMLEDDILALLDSGTEVITGPQELVNKINFALFEHATFVYSDQYVFSCEVDWKMLPDVTFVIGNKEYVFSAAEYIWVFGDERNWCQSGFHGVDDDYFVLGQPFLAKYYTRFDMKNSQVQIGEAKEVFCETMDDDGSDETSPTDLPTLE